MKINLVYNKIIPEYQKSLDIVESVLKSNNADFKKFELSNIDNYGDFTFVIGGDGTLLRAARFYAKTKIPVMGINLGRLGFLSQVEVSNFSKEVNNVLQGKYYTEDRLMLVSDDFIALNDFVIKGYNPSRTSKFFLEINEKLVCDYIADGIIISTPTGSTAYGLSAGGPVLHPGLNALVIVPICPHTLNARPLVIPAEDTVTVKTSDELLSVAIDGYDTTKYIEKISIKTSPDKAKLAFLNNGGFYSVLRNKLNWGVGADKS